jgi:hypothetical protein
MTRHEHNRRVLETHILVSNEYVQLFGQTLTLTPGRESHLMADLQSADASTGGHSFVRWDTVTRDEWAEIVEG